MPARSTAPTKYEGPEPGTAPLTEEEIDRLRSKMPDDAIRRPSGMHACEGCGIASDLPAIFSVPLSPDSKFAAAFTRCPDCQRLDDRARGDERTRNTLYALAVIGQPPPEDPSPLVPWMHVVGSKVSWLVPDAPSQDRCNPHPWAHVSLGHRARIKEAYLLAMRSRIRISSPPVRLAPPWGAACLFCGVGTAPVAPLEVARRGGREAAAHTVWRGVVAQPKAFGGHGPDLVDGFVCPTCAEAVDATSSVNRACARAFEEHARNRGIRVPADLGDLYSGGHPVVVPGWASLGTRMPNREPWAHIALVEEAS